MNSSLALIILFSFSIVSVFAESEDEIKSLEEKGDELTELGKYEEAISFYDKILEIDPNNLVALNKKGANLANLDKPEEALTYFEKALEIDPNYPMSLNNKGAITAGMGRFSEALEYFGKALDIDPSHESAKINFVAAASQIPRKDLEGTIEITLRDPLGNLVAYQKATHLDMLDHELTKSLLDEWVIVDTINRNGIDVQVRQWDTKAILLEPTAIGTFGVTFRTAEAFMVFSSHNALPVMPGDEISMIFTVFTSEE